MSVFKPYHDIEKDDEYIFFVVFIHFGFCILSYSLFIRCFFVAQVNIIFTYLILFIIFVIIIISIFLLCFSFYTNNKPTVV